MSDATSTPGMRFKRVQMFLTEGALSGHANFHRLVPYA